MKSADRALIHEEASLVRWLLEHGTDSARAYLPQLDDARVVSQCGCGCASVDFGICGVIPAPNAGMEILADFGFRTPEGHLCGVFVFQRAGLLAGLEVWSVDGFLTPSVLPSSEELFPLEQLKIR